MKHLLWTLALLGTAGCASDDAWRYQRVLHENNPEVLTSEDVPSVAAGIALKEELSLEDCYRLAVPRSESLAMTGEEIVRVQALYEGAVATVLPRIAFRGSYQRQEDIGSAASSSASTRPERTQYNFNLRQPIFSGLREFHAIKQADALAEAREHDLRQARLLLFADVAEAFYAILDLEVEIDTISTALRLAQERLEELVERNRAGISRRSEVLAQEAGISSTQAQMERLKGALAVAWETLRFLTGLDGPRRLVDTVDAAAERPPVETLVEKALACRSDLRALEEDVRAAEQGPGIARAGYLPDVALESNYYTHRAAPVDEIDWDLLMSLEMPVFEGGAVRAKVREAESVLRTARLRLEERRRLVRLDVNRAAADAEALRGEFLALDKAVASAEENYEIVQAEYRQNIVTNIEVLTSFDTLQRARLDRERARFQLKQAMVRLAVSTGTLPNEENP